MFSKTTDSSSQMSQLLNLLTKAEHKLDICIFLFTSFEMAQIARLRQCGAFVKTMTSTGLMHHKFAMIDNNMLLNGSFNWTGQAVLKNNENIIVSSNTTLVSRFAGEFERLWQLGVYC